MRPRNVLVVVMAIVMVVVVGYAVASRLDRQLPRPVAKACAVTTSSGTVDLNAHQMANAATVAAVGIRRNLPDRAIVIALATAFQESKLENISYGDRDSLGLFQQRPSQGWGTPEQIQDPRYAARRFYSALVRVDGWQKMRVTEAAQRVQRSAYPEAYQKWADEATVLAEALAGRATGAVSCTRAEEPALRGRAALEALGDGLRLDWGELTATSTSGVVGLALAAAEQHRGWQLAHWLVAHSHEQSVERVVFGGNEWTARRGAWRAIDTVDVPADQVLAEVYGS